MGCRSNSLSSPFSFFCCFVIVLLLLPAGSHGVDTLKRDESLANGTTLISHGRIFELGFFTPSGGNSSLYYLGIWYYGLPSRAVVWVANRNDPLVGVPGTLAIADGSLVMRDAGGGQRWTTNTTAASGGASVVLQLMDDGNLFLNTSVGQRARVLWQSFDHPTDTFLFGMRLTLARGARQSRQFTSWRSATDPSEGEYSLGMERTGEGSVQLFIWRRSTPYWRTGPWIGGRFSGVRVRPLSFYGWNFVPEDGSGSMVLSFARYNASLFWFQLQWDGRENISILDNSTKMWSNAFLQPSGECDIYNTCGANAKCTESGDAGKRASCQCLRGFMPQWQTTWAAGNWTGGCVRKAQLKCEMNATSGASVDDDGFADLRGVKLPDLSEWVIAATDADGCRRSCLNNCTCTAYTYVEGTGCMTWSSDLVDVQQFTDSTGYNIFIKLAASELADKDRIWILILIISLLVVIIFLLILYLWWNYKAKIKDWLKKSRKRGDTRLLASLGHVRQDHQAEFVSPAEFVDQSKDGKNSELPIFSFDALATATGYFHESNKLGQGGFGHVYKGILPGGREVAVKRLSEKSGQGHEEFKNEVILIAKLQHRNLVRLIGCCIQGDEKMLVYEYLPNKSLDAFIFNPSMRPLLDWRKRFNIIEGIARGMLYLHRDSRLRIIHRDLKASNILLDEEMNPKISDFGMARIFGGNQNQANTTRVVGTFGYMSPEYAMEGLFSIKSDVYSFGVLLLEIVSGHRNNSFHRTQDSPNLVGRAWQLWNEDKSLELVDPLIRSSISTREAMRCIQVGLLCVQDRANDRPTMTSVVFMLENEAMAHPVPKQPTFTLEGSPAETESVRPGCDTSADVTVTVVTGR
ncbi:hypothetical protein Taro_049077 [Colocasia esculenta]|uniref:Receptor-like serine/threonine-protein kinase n=1 Tax=Colocasia esculenta TaxID=4460 RepID=A0A843X9Z2_COLES|nr:hypothetical protein [Colocasia esculenta]